MGIQEGQIKWRQTMHYESKSRVLHYFTAIIAALALFTGCDKQKEDETEFNGDDLQSISQTMGHYVIENLNDQNLSLDIDAFIKGIKSAKAGGQPPLSKEKFNELLTMYRKKALELKESANLKLAEDFLEDNEKNPQVIVLEDGKLHYLILEEGDGESVLEDGTPLVHYEGKFIDGQVFDSTERRGNKPIPLSLKTTIPGFKSGVSGMKKGEKRRLFIHPDLGYRNRGRLPPNSMLIFDVKVIESETKNPETTEETIEESKETGMNWFKKWNRA